MGQAQNGTGVMAEQMEIHPGCNDVINAAESTFLPRTGKPSFGSISFYSAQVKVYPYEQSFVKMSILLFYILHIFVSCEHDWI